MAAPTLSKSGVTTVTLSTGSTFPFVDPHIPNQFIGVSDDNTIRVATLGARRKLLVLSFEQLSAIDKTAIIGFLENPLINYAKASFTWTDENNEAFTVRFLQPELSLAEDATDIISGSLIFTVVV